MTEVFASCPTWSPSRWADMTSSSCREVLGTRALQHDKAFIEWLRSAEPVKLKTSVCTGALLLGAAGFLAGKRATTHPNAFEELKPYCAVVENRRIVDEGGIVTARGVSSSLDLGLHLVERIAGTAKRGPA